MHNKNQLICNIIDDSNNGKIVWRQMPSREDMYIGVILDNLVDLPDDGFYSISKGLFRYHLEYVKSDSLTTLIRGKILKPLYDLAQKEAFENL